MLPVLWGVGGEVGSLGHTVSLGASPVSTRLPVQESQQLQVQSLGQKDPLEEGMAAHSGILAWRIPWTEEPGGLQSMGSHRLGHG